MIRSRKKTPIHKDGSKEIRKIGHRKLRRKVKMQVASGKETLSNLREVQNQYDVVDWKMVDCGEKLMRK